MMSLSPSYPTTKTFPLPPPSFVVLSRTSIPVSAVPRLIPKLLHDAAVVALLIMSGCFPSWLGGPDLETGGEVFGPIPAPLCVWLGACSAFSGSRVSGNGNVAGSVEEEEDVEDEPCSGCAGREVSWPCRPKAMAFSWSLLYWALTCFPNRRYCRKDCILITYVKLLVPAANAYIQYIKGKKGNAWKPTQSVDDRKRNHSRRRSRI